MRSRPTSSLVAIRAFRNQNYRLFWFGQLVSLTGTWMQELALAWLVLRISNSAFALGTVVALRFGPTLVLGLLGGVLADRVHKRTLLVLTQSVLLVQAAALGILTSVGLVGLIHIYALSLLRGIADAVDHPTRQSFVIELVGPADVPNAVALNSTQFNAARIVGPAIGGVMVATVGIAACFYLNALSFLAVVAALLMMRTDRLFAVQRAVGGKVLSQVREGLSYARATPDIALPLLLVAAIGTFGYNFTVILPLMARYVLDSGPQGLGALTSAIGLGSLVGAAGFAYRGQASRRALVGGAVGFTTLLFLLGISRWEIPTLLILVGIGICGITFMTAANTRLQLLTPSDLRGRVMSMYSLFFIGTTPIGAFLVGTLAEHSGVQAAVIQMGVFCAVGIAVGLAYWRRNRLAGEEAEGDLVGAEAIQAAGPTTSIGGSSTAARRASPPPA